MTDVNPANKKLLIIFHAPSENTIRMQASLLAGAQSKEVEGVDVCLKSPFDTTAEDINNADALILGTTENLGYMSGALKDMFDRTYYPCLEVTQGKPFAVVIRAGHDGTGTQRAIDTITTGLRWRSVQPSLICRGEFQLRFIEECQALGLTMAASLEAGVI